MQSFKIITPTKSAPFSIGRKKENSLVLDNPMVSRQHATLTFANNTWTITNLSKNSVTQVNGLDITECNINDGDEILIGVVQLKATLKNSELKLLISKSVEQNLSQTKKLTHDLISLDNLHIEMPKGTMARISNKKNSAQLLFTEKLIDTNNKYFRKINLEQNANIYLPNCSVKFLNDELTLNNEPFGFSVNIKNLNVVVKEKQLLENINFNLPAGKILAIIGRSGQGKSTLLRTLQGKLKCNKNSEIFIGGVNFNNAEIQKRIAFLEQEKELRNYLTVKETLLDGGKCSMSKSEFVKFANARIETLAELFGLNKLMHSHVKNLSGGECRRVALAHELMGNPGLIVLDEPLSGLDSYNSKILCKHLRQLAFLGHTIIFTTHSYESLEIADSVLMLHNGKQCFYGSLEEFKGYFKSDSPQNILAKITDDSAIQWTKLNKTQSIKQQTRYFICSQISSPFFYKILLAARERFRDKGKFFTLLLQPTIIGFLFSQIFSNLTSLTIISFALILSANWLSLTLSVREIVQEKSILNKEFIKGVSVTQTIAAKAIFATFIAWAQTLVVYTFISIRTNMHLPLLSVLTSTFFMVMPSIAAGFAISSFAKNSGQANAMLPLVIMPQVALAGALVPVDQMLEIGRIVSYTIWSKYNQTMFMNINLERITSIMDFIPITIITFCFYIIVLVKLNSSKRAR